MSWQELAGGSEPKRERDAAHIVSQGHSSPSALNGDSSGGILSQQTGFGLQQKIPGLVEESQWMEPTANFPTRRLLQASLRPPLLFITCHLEATCLLHTYLHIIKFWRKRRFTEGTCQLPFFLKEKLQFNINLAIKPKFTLTCCFLA